MECLLKKNLNLALAGVAQWIEHRPENQRITGLISSQGTCLGRRPGPHCGTHERQSHIDVSFFFKFFIAFSYSCVPFLPFPPPHPSQTPSFPHIHSPPWFGPCVLYSSSCNPLSSLSPPHSPLPIIRLFLTSMSLVIFTHWCFYPSLSPSLPLSLKINTLKKMKRKIWISVRVSFIAFYFALFPFTPAQPASAEWKPVGWRPLKNA